MRSWDERGNQSYEVIVHVARISESGGAGSHNGGHLQKIKTEKREILNTASEKVKLYCFSPVG